MSIDLNTTLDNIKYKLNTIFNSEKFAHELKIKLLEMFYSNK